MAKLLTLLIGLTLISCGLPNYWEGTLEPHRRVDEGVYIHSVSPRDTFDEQDTPGFRVKVVNDSAVKQRPLLSCKVDYVANRDEEVGGFISLAPRQWKRASFSTRPTEWRTRVDCGVSREER
jgi:hypothetical protein